MRNKIPLALAAFVMLALIVVGSFMPSVLPVSGAPAEAVLTPVVYGNTNGGARFAVFNAGTPVSADVRNCIDLGSYDVADYQVLIKQTVSSGNQTTVTTQYSNVSGNANLTAYYNTGATLLSGTPGPASTPIGVMSQQALFGRYGCVNIDVTNATPVSVYVSAVAK